MGSVNNMVRVQNHATRSTFDLGRKIAWTGKTGEFLPLDFIRVLPGDKIRGTYTHFCRTAPLNTAAFTRIREYINAYFVPYRYMWRFFPNFFTQMTNNVKQANGINEMAKLDTKHPYFSAQEMINHVYLLEQAKAKDQFGFSRSALSKKLIAYLGNPFIYQGGHLANDFSVDPFPLLAYQLIYNDKIRESQWEDSFAPAFNVDYLPKKGDPRPMKIPVSDIKTDKTSLDSQPYNMFDLRRVNYEKDLYFGLLPRPQYGDTAFVPTETTKDTITFNPVLQNNGYLFNNQLSASAKGPVDFSQGGDTQKYGHLNVTDGPAKQLSLFVHGETIKKIHDSITNAYQPLMSILEFRKSAALQKLKEIQLSNDQDYKSQVEAIYGAKVSSLLSSKCTWIGGVDRQLVINPQFNQNLTSGNNADIKGTGQGELTLNIDFENTTGECGIFMITYYNRPIIEYDIASFEPGNDICTQDRYPNPIFDRIGNEAVNFQPLGKPGLLQTTAGYSTRYIEWKTRIDVVRGAFSKHEGGTLNNWVNPLDPTTQFKTKLDFTQFKVNPHILDSTFTINANDSVNTDQFICNDFSNLIAERHFSAEGLPY